MSGQVPVSPGVASRDVLGEVGCGPLDAAASAAPPGHAVVYEPAGDPRVVRLAGLCLDELPTASARLRALRWTSASVDAIAGIVGAP